MLVQRGIQSQHGLGFEQLVTWNRQLAAQIKQFVLNGHQERAHTLRHVFAEQHADVGIEFVHVAHGVHTQAVFGNARVVAQSCGAVVAGAGGDLCQSLSHAVAP